MQKVLVYKPYLCYNVAMQETTTTTATAARIETAPRNDAEFEEMFGSEDEIQAWLDWRNECLQADMSEPFLDYAH